MNVEFYIENSYKLSELITKKIQHFVFFSHIIVGKRETKSYLCYLWFCSISR